MHKSFPPLILLLGTILLHFVAGCEAPKKASPVQKQVIAAPSASSTTSAIHSSVRIKAGLSEPFTDSRGNIWLADQGFSGGDVVERADLVITNTTEPELYRSEHYSMDSFSWPLANGNYVVKLHFCETYDGITGPGQRVFSFTVQGREFKDFDVWAKAGGPLTAYIETVPVEIKNGKLLITFTSNVENPQINGIEIIPQP